MRKEEGRNESGGGDGGARTEDGKGDRDRWIGKMTGKGGRGPRRRRLDRVGVVVAGILLWVG